LQIWKLDLISGLSKFQRHRGNPIDLLCSSFREQGKVKHSTHGRITGLTLEQLKLLQAAFCRTVLKSVLTRFWCNLADEIWNTIATNGKVLSSWQSTALNKCERKLIPFIAPSRGGSLPP
jgi:hypothetical protein